MTTFQIPEGKVVDRIELEAGESTATINIIYKEDKPKEKKRVIVLCETELPTCFYIGKGTGSLVFREDGPINSALFVPVVQAEDGEFVVVPAKVLDELLEEVAREINEVYDTPSDSFAHTEAVMGVHRHWQILHKLLSERK